MRDVYEKITFSMERTGQKKWIVVGKLWYKDNKYYFGYTEGVQEAMNSNNFVLFGQMQHIDKMYVSEELFPIFQNRLFQKKRPEYQDYLNWLVIIERFHRLKNWQEPMVSEQQIHFSFLKSLFQLMVNI